jgi:hypothetical protein
MGRDWPNNGNGVKGDTVAKIFQYRIPENGILCEEACALPGESNVNVMAGHGRVTFYIFKDVDTARENLQYALGLSTTPPAYGPVGFKAYDLSKTEILQYALGPPTGGTVLDVMCHPIYAIAAAREDKDAPTAKDPGRKVSFFAEAVDTDLLTVQQIRKAVKSASPSDLLGHLKPKRPSKTPRAKR